MDEGSVVELTAALRAYLNLTGTCHLRGCAHAHMRMHVRA